MDVEVSHSNPKKPELSNPGFDWAEAGLGLIELVGESLSYCVKKAPSLCGYAMRVGGATVTGLTFGAAVLYPELNSPKQLIAGTVVGVGSYIIGDRIRAAELKEREVSALEDLAGK